ncbi:MAG: HAMP domain-containing protein [Alphaproteobacteria bacterium]|nr:HAMP domain-containing protein [Alphaproteobacteria bacterium]
MRLRFKSILQRIISLHVVALAGVFGAISFAVWFVLDATANDFEQRLLLDHAMTVAEHLQLAGDRWTIDLPPDLAALYGRGYGGYALAIIDEKGRVVSSSLPRRETLFTPNMPLRTPAFFHQRRGKAAFYGIDFPVRKGDHGATIEVAQDLENADVIVDDVVVGFVRRVAWVVLPMFALLLALDVLIVGRALKPITTASQRARKIQPGSIGLRLPETGLPDEVLPLVVAVNQALDRLERGFQMQRDLTADAAHELRTPLAILMTMIDVLPDQKAAAELRPHILGMSRIVGQLLELAELESFTIGAEDAADLRVVCSDAICLMAPVALAQGKTIELNAPAAPVWVQGNAEMLFRAVRNLIENAIRYTAAATAVEVDVLASGAVTVKDRGPGVPATERELIFRRFWRRDRRGGPNAGLGLSIVQRAIQIHGGKVGVGEREGGGAVFSIALPVRGKVLGHSVS